MLGLVNSHQTPEVYEAENYVVYFYCFLFLNANRCLIPHGYLLTAPFQVRVIERATHIYARIASSDFIIK